MRNVYVKSAPVAAYEPLQNDDFLVTFPHGTESIVKAPNGPPGLGADGYHGHVVVGADGTTKWVSSADFRRVYMDPTPVKVDGAFVPGVVGYGLLCLVLLAVWAYAVGALVRVSPVLLASAVAGYVNMSLVHMQANADNRAVQARLQPYVFATAVLCVVLAAAVAFSLAFR